MWRGLGLVYHSLSRWYRLTNDRTTSEGRKLTTSNVYSLISSGSMEPAFYRGDILFLTNHDGVDYVNGDITVYKV